MTEEQVREALRGLVEKERSAGAFAEKCGVSPTFVSRVLSGRDPPSAKLLAPLGLRRVVTYEIAEASSASALDPTSGGGAGGRSASPGATPHGRA